ncbi:restriction endonuclease subunit S [Enterococcus mundtii]|uniref:restriction endonuclease subunit S n=1 Tax=Enterococcus mundtii TaxID=53346 RepID=UPI0021592199|nr:restriction endonuclease subunit S [Enterococcus mundtii]
MTKIEKKKAPTLRFPEFTEDWEQRKLSELASFSKGNGYTKNDLVESGEPIILYGRLYIKYETVIQDVDTFVIKKEKSIISEGNEVIVPASGESSEDISRASVVGRPGLILGGDLNVIKPVNYIDSIFLALTISNGAQQKEMSKRAQGKSVVHLHNSDLKQVNLLYPLLEEQQKIGSFFKQLDNTIALHQRKLDLLKEQKKGYLQKMFPKNGAKVPELRFAGFADDWEERKLRDLLNKNSEKNKNLSVINVESVSNKTGFTKQTEQFEDYSVASADLSNYYVIREKQFAYNPSRINVGSIAYKDLGDEISVVSPLYVSFSTKKVLNDGFLWNWFKTASFDAQRQRLSEGGVRDTLSFNQLSEMNTMFTTYPEQETIGSFFKQLDETIALHQRKLDLLKEQKKGFLQKMFV